MTREEAINILNMVEAHGSLVIQAKEMAIKALEQEPCEDAISRQAVLDEINDTNRRGGFGCKLSYTRCKGHIEQLPPVKPQYSDAEIQKMQELEQTEIEKAYELGKTETGWIPVSEKLPEAGEYVGDVAKYYLVQNEDGDMLVARYTHSEYWEQIYQLNPIGGGIVAWMPLPEPYKQEAENG